MDNLRYSPRPQAWLFDGILDGQVEDLKRISVRFVEPVFPGDELTTEVWKDGDGEPVLSRGEINVQS